VELRNQKTLLCQRVRPGQSRIVKFERVLRSSEAKIFLKGIGERSNNSREATETP